VCIYTTFSTETLGWSSKGLMNSFIDCIQTYTETTEIISSSDDSDSIPGLSVPSGLYQPARSVNWWSLSWLEVNIWRCSRRGSVASVNVLFNLRQNNKLVKISCLTLHCTLPIYKATKSSIVCKLFVTACGSVHSHWLYQLDLRCFSPSPYWAMRSFFATQTATM
jgi:hypothetical protein